MCECTCQCASVLISRLNNRPKPNLDGEIIAGKIRFLNFCQTTRICQPGREQTK
ncbi:hypothetical protein O3G_MSEX005418 [Manduca sexta]|uniref:Uncharacterized protein n=1 Tax=Manduca sexta TaxID=7130 RepID=A0A922CIN3_MANSE|nr:hypothetical protein O3G_MSEX005418 [Manduca sexta]KAG6448280.1 hypothetical protein O3G_MSEX005418 [Manduca sexta]